ncbi:MAG: hypothetical protein MJ221_01890 [Bacilli bacterium]|nr:hypothetical protein [Bacilli bacterium]
MTTKFQTDESLSICMVDYFNHGFVYIQRKEKINMNKLFTKIVGLCLGLTMAVGVGLVVGLECNDNTPIGINAAAGDTVSFSYTTSSSKKLSTTYGNNTLVDDNISGLSVSCVTAKLSGNGAIQNTYNNDFGGQQMTTNANRDTTVSFTFGYPWAGDHETYGKYTQINSVKFTGVAGSSTSYKVTCTIDGVAATGDNTGFSATKTTTTFTPASGHNCGGIVLTIEYVSGSKGWYFDKLEINSEVPASSKTLDHISVGGSMSKTDYNTAESWDPSGLTVTAHYDDESTLDVTNGAEWEFDPSAPAVGVTSVTATATYEGKTADSDPQTVTVTEYVADLYEKIISAPSDWSGEYLLVYEPSASTARVWTGVDAVSCYVETSIVDSQIAKPLGSVSLTIASMTGGYSIKINGGDNNGKYICGKSGSNTIQYGETAVANTIAFVGGKVNIESNSTYFCYNSASGNDRFRYYKSTTTGATYILPSAYKKVEPYTISSFVTDWNTATNAACSNPDADNTTAITNAWGGIKANYLKLSEADQATVAAGGDPTPASLIERYDHIVERYGLENFMNRSVTPSPRINLFDTMNDNGSIAIIVIVSLLSVTAIGGYFFIRRRKEN